MPIHIRRGWELPDSAATPEHLVLGRRKADATCAMCRGS